MASDSRVLSDSHRDVDGCYVMTLCRKDFQRGDFVHDDMAAVAKKCCHHIYTIPFKKGA